MEPVPKAFVWILTLDPGGRTLLHQPCLSSGVVVVEIVDIASAGGHGDHHLPMDDELREQARGPFNGGAAQFDDDVLWDAKIWPSSQDALSNALEVS